MLHGFQLVVHVVLCPVVPPCLSGRLAFLFPALQFLPVQRRPGSLLLGTASREFGQSLGDTLLLVQRFAFLQQGFFQGGDFGCQVAYLLQQLHFTLPCGVYLLLQQFYDFLVCHSVKIRKINDIAKETCNYFTIKNLNDNRLCYIIRRFLIRTLFRDTPSMMRESAFQESS